MVLPGTLYLRTLDPGSSINATSWIMKFIYLSRHSVIMKRFINAPITAKFYKLAICQKWCAGEYSGDFISFKGVLYSATTNGIKRSFDKGSPGT